MLVFIIEEEKCNGCGAPAPRSPAASQLFQWPVQIKLMPVKVPLSERGQAARCRRLKAGGSKSEDMTYKYTNWGYLCQGLFGIITYVRIPQTNNERWGAL